MSKQKKEQPKNSFCLNCGSPLVSGYAFCRNCGTPVSPAFQTKTSHFDPPEDEKKGRRKKAKTKSASSKNTEKKNGKGAGMFAFVQVLKLIAGGILSFVIALLLFALAGAVIISFTGSSAISWAFISSFLKEEFVSSLSVISYIICSLVCALLIALDILLNFHNIKRAFLQISIAFTASSLLLFIFMLALLQKELCLFVASGLLFIGAIFMLLYSIVLASSKKHIKMLSDVPRPRAYTR